MNYEQAMEYIHAVQWAGHKPGLTRMKRRVYLHKLIARYVIKLLL